MSRKPVLIDLEDARDLPGPDEAPPVPEDGPVTAPEGRAMLTLATLAARPPSRLARWFWGAVLGGVGIVVSVRAWDFAMALIARAPILGYALTGLFGLALVLLAAIALREIAAFSRLGRIDGLRQRAEAALAEDNLSAARALSADLIGLYGGREDTRWGRARLTEQAREQFDASAVLGLAETEILAALDAAATREIEAAARQVATITALVPLALADVIGALTANLRMIRRIAEIYGGRSGVLGSWRLARAVITHLVATGAVAVGDDLIGSVAGGNILSKISRRFGEGIVNGALTARVGVAAMEVCRPLPFSKKRRPSVTRLVKNALAGLFAQR